MKIESSQHELGRQRPPRVQITYDVETGGAIEKKELPLVIGILANLSGANPPDKTLKERRFVSVDKDNFDQVMGKIKPRVTFSVKNTVDASGANLSGDLTFKKMDDFLPANIVRSVPKLNKLFETRNRLSDLLAKLDGNDTLDSLLQEVKGSDAKLTELKTAGGTKNG